jgi:hypothetical protein
VFPVLRIYLRLPVAVESFWSVFPGCSPILSLITLTACFTGGWAEATLFPRAICPDKATA